SSSFLHCSGAPRALHSFPTRRSSELRLNTGSTIGATRLEVNLSDRGRQRLIRYCPRRRDTVTPGVVAGPRNLKHPARHRDGEARSEEHTSELQSRENLVCRLLLEKKK